MKQMIGILIWHLLAAPSAFCQQAPVTPRASEQAKGLLQLLNDVSGKHILSGQHNFPISGAGNSEFASDYIGMTPVVWSQDFGFSEAGDKDSYLSRTAIVDEAIRQHKKGSVITLCWHAVPPTADEPITFMPLAGYDTTALASVQGKLLKSQFEDIFKKGTAIHKKWLEQVDEIAGYLKQLEEAGVPLLWRPYHEMNGDWFWWGGVYQGKYTTKDLYRQLFDRLVKHHRLRNLIWVWSVDRPGRPGSAFENYYPGNDYVDVVSLDVYGSDFDQKYYEGLRALARGKPLALGEVGVPPTLGVLEKQPGWTYYVIWSGMARGTPRGQYRQFVTDSRVLFLEDNAFQKLTRPYRAASHLPPLHFWKETDFTGSWKLNESESLLQNTNMAEAPDKMTIVQLDSLLAITSSNVLEWRDDKITKQLLRTNGTDIESVIYDSPGIRKATWSRDRDTLTINSTVTLSMGGKTFEIRDSEVWTTTYKGNKLFIEKTVISPGGTRTSTLVYDHL